MLLGETALHRIRRNQVRTDALDVRNRFACISQRLGVLTERVAGSRPGLERVLNQVKVAFLSRSDDASSRHLDRARILAQFQVTNRKLWSIEIVPRHNLRQHLDAACGIAGSYEM